MAFIESYTINKLCKPCLDIIDFIGGHAILAESFVQREEQFNGSVKAGNIITWKPLSSAVNSLDQLPFVAVLLDGRRIQGLFEQQLFQIAAQLQHHIGRLLIAFKATRVNH